MQHTFTTHNDELGAKLKKVMDEHQAAKDPYPHYYGKNDVDAVVFSALGHGRWRVNPIGTVMADIGDSDTGISEPYFTRLTKAEFEARVEAAQDKARWAEGSRWLLHDGGKTVVECAKNDLCTYHNGNDDPPCAIPTTFKSLLILDYYTEITPSRAREILAGWKAEKEVRCFAAIGRNEHIDEHNHIAIRKYIGGKHAESFRCDGSNGWECSFDGWECSFDGTRTSGKFAEFPPAEWDRRVKALQPDPYAEAKAAYADGVLQFRDKPCGLQAHSGEWIDHSCEFKPAYFLPPEQYRRRPTTKKTITVACSECGSHISYCPYCGKHMKVRINQGE